MCKSHKCRPGFLFSVLPSILILSCSNSKDDLRGVQVPPGYSVEIAAGPELVDYPMFGMIDETGRLFLFESTGDVYDESQDAIDNPQFRINLLEDLDEDGIYDKSTIFADSIGFPQGGVFYNGSLIASSAPDLLKLTDTDGDGVADQREVLLSGWTLNVNANSLIGPFMGPDGWLYLTSAIEGFDVTTKEGERLKGETARIWRVRPDGSGLEWVSAGGMNNPVELTFTETGEAIGTMTYFTEPKGGLRDALIYWTEGGVYPKPNNNIARDGLIRTGELMPVITKFTRVAPAGICRYRSTVLGEDFYDNLFSVQFNTHRVLRHKLFRDGASFRTEEEIFFWTDDLDFHPTDVLEDADGSLLVVETGGWFIKGCPLSQMSKPLLEGAIYRIRPEDATEMHDPYGKEIDWESLPSGEVVNYLEDNRTFVADRAQKVLVERGEEAIESLTTSVQQSSNVNARIKAVFTLYQIGNEQAIQSAMLGLSDNDSQVRLAATRVAGMTKDNGSLERLIELVQSDEPQVRRQSATALGQIGQRRAVSTLFSAIADNEDRFIEHAIIFALISINDPNALMTGLNYESPQVRKAALISLDQIQPSPLRAHHIIPFLESEEDLLQQTGLWVASHHPEWARGMRNFLEQKLNESGKDDREQELLTNMLMAFSGDETIQKLIADRMRTSGVNGKLYLMDVMSKCELDTFPVAWSNCLGDELKTSYDFTVQTEVLKLVRLRDITLLLNEVKEVANTNSNSVIRMEAMSILSSYEPESVREYFDFLYNYLDAKIESSIRQRAASTISQGDLTREQLMKLINDFLPDADAYILPRLLPAFYSTEDPDIIGSLAQILIESPSLDNFTEEHFKEIFPSDSPELQPVVDPLIKKWNDVRASRLERLEDIEAQIIDGDIERGREIYFGKSTCWTCHTIGTEGGDLGPDLTSIQRDRSIHDLLEAILYPNVSFVREYETYRITTETNTYQGVIQEQTPEYVVLGIAPENSIRIPADELISIEISDVSLMPQGLEQLLTSQELADLMAFILGQDQDPELDEELLR